MNRKQNSIFKKFLDKIEPKLFNIAKEMKVPTLEEDLGILIFEATFYRYSKQNIYKEKSLLLFEKLINVYPERELGSGFLEGFEGVFWVISYLEKCNIIDDLTLLDDLMPYLINSLKNDIKYNNYDVLHGSINKLQFLINNQNFSRKDVSLFVDSFINSLYSNRNESEGGIYWIDEFDNEGVSVNIGLAHGLPSILIFLVKLKELNFKHSNLDKLINGIIVSLLNFKNKNSSYSRYPGYYRFNEKETSSRLAYCYGDLGIAYAFLYAATILKRKDLQLEAIETIKYITNRDLKNSEVVIFENTFYDTAFCHGLSGITYMLKKINNLLKESDIKQTLENRISYWENKFIINLTEQLKIENEICYPDHKQLDKENPFVIDDQSILGGYTGTGLVLLSLIYKKYDWSDFFLLY